jgi:hypothetical protein
VNATFKVAHYPRTRSRADLAGHEKARAWLCGCLARVAIAGICRRLLGTLIYRLDIAATIGRVGLG